MKRVWIFRKALLTLAILCLATVFAAAQQDFPLAQVNASRIGQTVTVSGRIVNVIPSFDQNAPHIIYISDGRDSLRVLVWQETFNQIPEREKIAPQATLRATGIIKDYQSHINLNVSDPRGIQIISSGPATPAVSQAPVAAVVSAVPTPAPVPLPPGVLAPSQINSSLMNQIVTVQGLVSGFRPAGNERAPNNITLKAPSGETISVVYWKQVADILGLARTPAVGQTLRIKGKVSEHREQLQLRVENAADIQNAGTDVSAVPQVPTVPQSPAAPAAVSVAPAPGSPGSEGNPEVVAQGGLTRDHIGRFVTVQGRVVDIKPSWKETAPTTVSITDGVKSMDFVYWPDTEEKMSPDQKPARGMQVKVTGQVKEFRNALQVNVSSPAGIVVQATTSGEVAPAAAAPVSRSREMTIGQINREHLDQTVHITGTISSIANIGGGRLLKVSDSTGTITVPLWDDVAAKLPQRDKIRQGARIDLSGIVTLYEKRNEIQIKLTGPEQIISVE